MNVMVRSGLWMEETEQFNTDMVRQDSIRAKRVCLRLRELNSRSGGRFTPPRANLFGQSIYA